MRFFTSDTHFGHARIIELCDRPFRDIDEMDAAMVDNWNNVVGPDDEVYHLGDVALGPWVRWNDILSALNGYKYLIIGNHDRVFSDNKPPHVTRFWPIYEQWFETLSPAGALILEDGTEVSLSHFPYDGDSHDGDRYRDARLGDTGVPLIHGHTHLDKIVSRSSKGTVQIHVGADAHNYTPVSEQQVMDYLRVADDTEGDL